jgi:UDP-glucose 4,6-dehydratase
MNKNKRIAVVTGGAGFLGSHLVDGLMASSDFDVVKVIDKLTYAGNLYNCAHHLSDNRFEFLQADICDFDAISQFLVDASVVFHLAAESHVDNSFKNSSQFFETNIVGTQKLVEASVARGLEKIIVVSTDEVYGPRHPEQPAFEDDVYAPTNPYAVSKVGGELIAQSVCKNYDYRPIIVRPNNIFGQRQFPEKLIPQFVWRAANGQKMQIQGDGKQRRRFLDVSDFVNGMLLIQKQCCPGDVFNIGTKDSYSVLEIAKLVANFFEQDVEELTEFVQDRPYNDFGYATDTSKIEKLGWKPQVTLAETYRDKFSTTLNYLRNLRTPISNGKKRSKN